MHIAFDLDGTISDPAEGITNALNYALDKLGLPRKNPHDLTKYIGPPLDRIFGDLIGNGDADRIKTAVSLYREHYYRIGYRENTLYQGMNTILDELSKNGNSLYVATTKRTDIAEKCTEYFNITRFFKRILGGGMSRGKHELLTEIKEKEEIESLIMIGDRSMDMAAGKANNCLCVGVLWGYGSKDELLESGADVLLKKPEQILELKKVSTPPETSASPEP